MSARQNIRSAHAELKKTLEDGGIQKRAKERNECLTPGDPQSCHVLSTALGEHLASLDLDVAVHVVLFVRTSRLFLFISVLLVPTAKRSSPKVVRPNEFSHTSAS